MTCYGNNGVGDDNDVWQIVVDDRDLADVQGLDGQLKLLTTRFRIVHKNMVCGVFSLAVLVIMSAWGVVLLFRAGAELCQKHILWAEIHVWVMRHSYIMDQQCQRARGNIQ